MSGSDSEEGHIRSVWWQGMGRDLGQQTEAGCGCGGSHDLWVEGHHIRLWGTCREGHHIRLWGTCMEGHHIRL